MKKLIILIILISGLCYSQTTFIPTGGTTIYDLQSTGTAKHIAQDKNNPNNIHAVYTSSPYSDSSTYAQRTVNYYFSSDKGNTWSFISSFPQIYKTGFPSVSVLSNGCAIITMHGGVLKKTYTFADAFPGLGSFSDLGSALCFDMLPQIAASNNINEQRKFHIINQAGFTSGLSLTSESYAPCMSIPGMSSDAYSIAIGTDGRIGIAYVVDVAQLTGNSGDVFFMESFDNGETFTAPLKIFNAVINADNTFYGAFRGISLVYNNNRPNLVFEVCKQHLSGNYFPDLPGGIMYWSPALTGSDPNRCKYIARNDSANFYPSYIPFYKSYGNYDITSICRPSIGTFSDSNYMAVVFMSSTPKLKVTGLDTAGFNSLYLTYTYNKGIIWTRPKRITPDERMDWTFPSISVFNLAGSFPYKANITATKDSVPGSYVLNNPFTKSLAQQFYIRTDVGYLTEPGNATITSGIVKYDDNNQPVTTGTVRALQFNESTGQSIVIASSPIDANGNYSLNFNAPFNDYYIVAYPNSEKESDYIQTYYPQSIYWLDASTINSSNNNYEINIDVYRKTSLEGFSSVRGVVNSVKENHSSVLPEADLYLKLDNKFVGYSESNSSGRYSFSNIPPGTYEIIATKLGYTTLSEQITIQGSQMDSINFALTRVPIGSHQGSLVPDKFYLYQNFPNPFNPVTSIKYDISADRFVSLKIYNILGKVAAVPVNEFKQAGSYTINFDAGKLPSGIYFYKLETESFSQTRRMVILK
ncbi:MAG: carboxypeptidase regulatory-like domain-containing protein [Bacteroidetes bacterium]|nr:carboxypeptidase regulatory-like domain-containing protein [Bacteroidota bacterium]